MPATQAAEVEGFPSWASLSSRTKTRMNKKLKASQNGTIAQWYSTCLWYSRCCIQFPVSHHRQKNGHSSKWVDLYSFVWKLHSRSKQFRPQISFFFPFCMCWGVRQSTHWPRLALNSRIHQYTLLQSNVFIICRLPGLPQLRCWGLWVRTHPVEFM